MGGYDAEQGGQKVSEWQVLLWMKCRSYCNKVKGQSEVERPTPRFPCKATHRDTDTRLVGL